MLFITHVVPRGLQAAEVIQFRGPAQPQSAHMAVVDGQKKARMRTSKTPGEYILIILLALLFCWMGYRAYLNFIGYCPDKGRVLTEQEKLAPVIEYLALAHPRDAGPPLVPPKETRLYYDSMQEFLRDNPDCCHVVKAFYTIDTGWFRLGVWNRLCGFATYLVSVKFYRRYRNERGEVRKELAEGGYPMTSCGKMVDLIELI